MKKSTFIPVLSLLLFFSWGAVAKKAPSRTVRVVYGTSIHCRNCAKKVEENVGFEKGVRDISTSVENKTVMLEFDPAKTDTAKLGNAIRKLGYTARVIEMNEVK